MSVSHWSLSNTEIQKKSEVRGPSPTQTRKRLSVRCTFGDAQKCGVSWFIITWSLKTFPQRWPLVNWHFHRKWHRNHWITRITHWKDCISAVIFQFANSSSWPPDIQEFICGNFLSSLPEAYPQTFTTNYGKFPVWMRKLTTLMAMFNVAKRHKSPEVIRKFNS